MCMKRYIILIVFLLVISNVSAANIHGEIYDISLNLIKDVVVEINTNPKQTVVSKDGSYSFDVPAGNYVIKAIYNKNGILEGNVEEKINVVTDGDYVLDLILIPSLEDNGELGDINIGDVDYGTVGNGLAVAFVFVVIVIAIFVYFLFFKKKKEVKEEDIDGFLDKILNIIKENDGRITQKDIRKKINLSEAKISLVISQLEHESKVKKIKKGRGNIIILNK